jgi:hypothetical protein
VARCLLRSSPQGCQMHRSAGSNQQQEQLTWRDGLVWYLKQVALRRCDQHLRTLDVLATLHQGLGAMLRRRKQP